jgi:hypothetical protein
MPLARIRASISFRSASVILKLMVGFLCLLLIVNAPFVVHVAAGVTSRKPHLTIYV